MTRYEMRILVNGEVAACVSGPKLEDVQSSAVHYALVYRDDGPTTIEERKPGQRSWKRIAAFDQRNEPETC